MPEEKFRAKEFRVNGEELLARIKKTCPRGQYEKSFHLDLNSKVRLFAPYFFTTCSPLLRRLITDEYPSFSYMPRRMLCQRPISFSVCLPCLSCSR